MSDSIWHRAKRRSVLLIGCGAFAALGIGLGIGFTQGAAGSSTPIYPTTLVTGPDGQTFGNLPASAFSSNGIDWSQAPDYVAVVGKGGVIGYVPKAQMEQALQQPPSSPLNGGMTSVDTTDAIETVYNTQLQIIGYIYRERGYVPVGEALPPAVPPTTVVGS